jgi:hypothetical protein
MDIQERYCGIEFIIGEDGVGRYRWEIQPPEGLPVPKLGASGTVQGGQNEAILTARKAIRIYLDEPARQNR